MKKSYVFLFIVMISLFNFNLVLGQENLECDTIGSVNYDTNKYCSSQGVWTSMKEGGESCANTYECLDVPCVDGLCQSSYSTSSENTGILNSIYVFVSGKECTPGSEKCDGTSLSLCGATGLWESKGNVINKCGYTSSGGGGSGGGGSRSRKCTPSWNCTSWSDSINNCGTRICTDKNKCGDLRNKPAVSVSCPGVQPICGDGVCDALIESTQTCTNDCPAPPVVTVCGNGICEEDESSLTCNEDCEAIKPKSKWWLFALLIFIFISLWIVVIIFILKRIKQNRSRLDSKVKPGVPSQSGNSSGK